MSQVVYTVYELEPGVIIIEEENVRCFLFDGREKALLVDTGFGGGDLKELVAGLTTKPLVVVNTHADRDHIGGNRQFAEIWMHPAEYDRYAQALTTRPEAGLQAAQPQADQPLAVGQRSDPPVNVSAAPQVGGASASHSRPRLNPLWEGDIIDIGGRFFEVVLIPGHTPGSVALLDWDNDLLISGDTVQDGDVYMFKAGRNLPAYIESLRKLKKLADSGAFSQIYPSHGTVPLRPDVITQLIDDAQTILAGNAEGTEGELFGAPIMEYRMKAAGFLCNR